MQFTLRQLLLGTTWVCVCFGLCIWAGVVGVLCAVGFMGASGIGLFVLAITRHSWGYALLSLVAFVFGGIFLGTFAFVAIGSGHRSALLTFAIQEAGGHGPIPHAKVRIRDPGDVPFVFADPVPPGENGAEGFTDAQGLVTLTCTYPCSNQQRAFHDESKIFPFEWVQVSAPGFESAVFELRSLFPAGFSPDQLPLPPIPFPLKRAPPKPQAALPAVN